MKKGATAAKLAALRKKADAVAAVAAEAKATERAVARAVVVAATKIAPIAPVPTTPGGGGVPAGGGEEDAEAQERRLASRRASVTAVCQAVKAEAAGGRSMTSDHLRRGGVGDWRNHFDEPLAALFRQRFAERMRGSGLTFDIGDGEELVAPVR